MAQARSFRPPTSGLFGQADRAAALQLSATAMSMLQSLSDEEIAVEDSRQVANAMAALEGERGKLNDYMDKNPDKAEQWGKWFAGEKEGIRTRVMAGITTPGAQQRVSNAMIETLAGWANTVADRRRTQIWKNANTDFEATHDAYSKRSVQYKSRLVTDEQGNIDIELDDGAVTRMAEALAAIGDAHDQRLAAAATNTQVEQLQREVAHQIIGDNLVQITQNIEDPKTRKAIIGQANTLAQEFGLPAQTFGPDDLAAINTKVNNIRRANRTEMKNAREARVDAFSADLAKAVSQGKYREAMDAVYDMDGLTLDEQSSFLDYILKAEERKKVVLDTPEKKRYREDLMSRARRATTTEQQNALTREVISAASGDDPSLDYDDSEEIRKLAETTFAEAQDGAISRAVSNTDILVRQAEDALEALKNLQLLTAEKLTKEEGETLIARIAEANDRLIAQKRLQDKVIQEIHAYAANEANWKNDAKRIWIDTQQMIEDAADIADEPLDVMEAMLDPEGLGLTLREIEMAARRAETSGMSFQDAIKRAQMMNAPAKRQGKTAEPRVFSGAFQSISKSNTSPKVMTVRGRPELTEVYMADGSVMRPGDIYEQGGKRYRFKGLDENNDLDFEEIK